ncbi:hypothetical protein GCM10015535_53220 [Streptomyces gelaticus]|uniref:Uncharacterized protein n=1 Tax=Streptomyces gelaticus TaxID=285446 RepID=A0ABQ2W4V3_9ACTN|nr:hypothetical protein GCM10015535_53220 [Streptomyces gelaticus]
MKLYGRASFQLSAAAAALTDDHPWGDPHGPGSLLARLVALDGRVLMLGAPLETLALLHHFCIRKARPGSRPLPQRGRRPHVTLHGADEPPPDEERPQAIDHALAWRP